MVTKQHYGIKGLYKSMRQALPTEQLIEESVDAEIVHESDMREKKQRDSAGGRGKADSFAPKKKIVADTHARLKTQLSKNPPLKNMMIELRREHPKIDWKEGGVKDWLARLNKHQSI